MEILGIVAQDAVGMIFIASFVVFGYGVSIPGNAGMDRSVFGTTTTEHFLDIIGSHPHAWRRSAAWLAAGNLLSMAGFGLVTLLTGEAGAPLLSVIAIIFFLISTIAWISGMTFRISIETFTAKTFKESTQIPDWFEPLQEWNNTMLMLYMELGYIATAMIGTALLQSSLLPDWIGWLTFGFGAGGAVSILTKRPKYPGTKYSIAAIPLWLHIMPLIIGITLIIR